LLLCRLVRPQHRRLCQLRCCIYIAVPCASTTVLRNLCHTMCLHKVFVIESPLPAPSLSPAHRPPLASPLSLLADAFAPALLLLCPAQPRYQRRHLVPTHFIYSDNRVLHLLPHCSVWRNHRRDLFCWSLRR
jgi:hypothetical protein